MSEMSVAIENLDYAIDVLQEYTAELKKQNNSVEMLFILGKIRAAINEVEVHHDCLADIVCENINNDDIDSVRIPENNMNSSAVQYNMFRNGDYIGISKETVDNQNRSVV